MCSYEIIWLNYNENESENEKQITKIRHKQNLVQDMVTDIPKIKRVSV